LQREIRFRPHVDPAGHAESHGAAKDVTLLSPGAYITLPCIEALTYKMMMTMVLTGHALWYQDSLLFCWESAAEVMQSRSTKTSE
jgi:hypothetical protein